MDFPVSPPGGYAVIVVDPPWHYSRIGYKNKQLTPIPDQYPLMSLSDIVALPIIDLAALDCHLFLWSTQKYLRRAFTLIEDWGFVYKRLMVWHKEPQGVQLPGLPDYNCEFVLHGTRGKPQWQDVKRFKLCFTARRRRHSEKPSEFYELLERVTPSPRIDLFARKRHSGFDAWGNEVVSDECDTTLINGDRGNTLVMF